MGYLDENPEFHHQLLLVRGDVLWLVLDERGAWAVTTINVTLALDQPAAILQFDQARGARPVRRAWR